MKQKVLKNPLPSRVHYNLCQFHVILSSLSFSKHIIFSFMIISSANRIAGINKFYKDVKLDDDRFEVLLCNINKKKDIIKSFYFLTMHDATKVPGIYTYKTNNIKIKL